MVLSKQGTCMKALIVDDDLYHLKLTSFLIEDAGYSAETTNDSNSVLQAVRNRDADIIILDVEMPHMNGFDLCREIRRVSDVPIIFLSGRNKLQDRVQGLGIGADDYLTKPFEPLELLARMEAVLRRHNTGIRTVESEISHDGITLDPVNHMVTFSNNRSSELTPIEFRLLYYLMQNAGRILSTDQILDKVWGYNDEGGRNLVAVYIRRLRTKIQAANDARQRIRTITKIGYCFDT
jgi:two-component system, OmpR family, response regulator RegX3